MRDAIAILLSLGTGALLARYDLTTDDTGIEVGVLFVTSILLAVLVPKRWWLIALCIGLPIPIVEIVVAHGSLPPGGVAALGVAIVGALIGFAIARASRRSAAA